MVDVLRETPFLLIIAFAGEIVFPSGFLALVGLACWRRQAKSALYGLLLLIFIVLLVVVRQL